MNFRRLTLPSTYQPGMKLRKFDEDLIKALDGMINNLLALFDNGVDVNDNLDVEALTITTNGTPDTEDAFTHTLRRVPSGYLVANKDKAGHIYSGGTAWTSTAIYLRSDVASVTAKVVVF